MSQRGESQKQSANHIKLACASVAWRQFNAAESVVFAEIARAGFAAAPWKVTDGRTGPPTVLADEIVEKYARHGLEPAPGYLWANFWEGDHSTDVAWRAAVTKELGLDVLFVSAGGFDRTMSGGRRRDQIPGRVTAADGLTTGELAQFETNMNRAGRIALDAGVKLAYHPHVGTVIESPAEVEWLLDNSDPEALFLGPDTGHLRWGGTNVEEFFDSQAHRIVGVHAKDVDADVVQVAAANEWEYGVCERNGVFTEIGRGCIDFSSLFSSLDRASFAGWVIAETDYTLLPTALESAIECYEQLTAVGFGAER